MGDLYRALGQGEKARDAYQSSLRIRERLAESEPERADYQQDLALSYERFGDVYLSEENLDKAREAFSQALEIRDRLAAADPGRADYQFELMVPLTRLGRIQGRDGKPDVERAIAILERLQSEGRLAKAEEGRLEAARQLLAELE